LHWPCDPDTAKAGLFNSDDLEHCVNQIFTEDDYISPFHLPPAPSADSENSETKINQEKLIAE